MTTTQITRTEQAADGTVTFALTVDGERVSFMLIDAATRKVCNVETANGFERRGFARSLWVAANAEAECFHDMEHHRTVEGGLFAEAMGGRTISDELGHQAECCICAGDYYTDDDEMER